MKRKIYIPAMLFLVGLSLASQSFAQRNGGNGPVTPVRVGSVILNLGVGVGHPYKYAYNSNFGTKAALEFGIWQAGPGVVTLGGEVGASFSNRDRNDDYKARTVVVAVRSAWHYGWKVRGLDTYGGVATGLGFHNRNYDNDIDRNEVRPVVGAFVGASYFVTPNFGFNAEAGNDITAIQAGIVFKLK
ncbi:MAG: hypothetical protein Q7T76_03165 [Ferruginibacter sp.]|nr:hypothetical protein [Ferruginibacter sp.]